MQEPGNHDEFVNINDINNHLLRYLHLILVILYSVFTEILLSMETLDYEMGFSDTSTTKIPCSRTNAGFSCSKTTKIPRSPTNAEFSYSKTTKIPRSH